VDSILKVFAIAVNVLDCLFHSTYKLKSILWKHFRTLLEHFFDEKYNAFKNALEYCQKLNDQNLFDFVYKIILDICCTCANHMWTRVDEDRIRSLYNRCMAIILVKWNNIIVLQRFQEKLASLTSDSEKTAHDTEEVNESSIRYYGQIAKFGSEELHEQAIIKLSAALDVFSGRFVKLVAEQISAVSAFRRVPLRELYIEAASELMSLLVRKLVANLRQSAPIKENIHFIDDKLSSLLKMKIARLCIAFGLVKESNDLPDLTDWRRLSERYIIPYLMMYHCVESTRVHKALASFLKTTRYLLISQNISHILLQLATSNVGDDEAREIMNFVESECTNSSGQFAEGDDRHQAPRERITFSRLIADNNFRCVTSLLTNLSAPEVDELYIFKNLHNVYMVCQDLDTSDFVMDMSSPRKVSFSMPDVIRDLSGKFFGILIIFEEKLRSTNPRRERIIAMRSFSRFINLSDPVILGKAALKALSILMFANDMLSMERYSTCSDFIRAISEAWLTFVRTLPVQDLQKLCLQILINLTMYSVPYKLFEEVLNFFANERNCELEKQISDFSFLLDCPYFDIVRSRMSEALKQSLQNFGDVKCSSRRNKLSKAPFNASIDIQLELRRILEISRYENSDLKFVCLNRTLHCLESRRGDMYRLVSKSDYIDSTIFDLIEFLLSSLRHSDLKVRNLSAVCIGELGAIDPGRLRADGKVDFPSCNIKNSVAPNVSSMDFDDPNSSITFASQLLTELNKYLIASTDGSTFNMFSYVLQETLKFLECNTEKRLMKNTPAELIWNSLSDGVRLSLSPSLSTMYVMHRRSTDGTITYPIFSSKDVGTFHQWHIRFISDLINKMNHPKGKEFFKSLEIAALHDLNVSRFILPHVVLQKLKEQDDVGAEVVLNEIKVILSHDSSSVNSELSTHVTQEIFSLLDFLHCWSCKSYAEVEKQLEKRRVECFLNEISFVTLSECAVRNQAYTRALMYYEAYISENLAKCQSNSKRDAVQPFLEKLQEIYAHINDVDAVVGILDIRKTKGQPSAKEEVLALECAVL
uniref:non-specific serine/threonine protein kinase n=1 Tax=Romanomermis culicivorax TaxID=13658 RepID=A0A915IDF8_ROMCU